MAADPVEAAADPPAPPAIRILVAARREFDYNRVRILLDGLERLVPGQVECFVIARRDEEHGERLRAAARRSDLIYVPPFRARDLAFVRRYGAGRPVVFDPLIGTYITRVVDYGRWWRTPDALWRDRRDFRLPDHLIFDTDAHRAWAVATFGLDAARCHTLHIGAWLGPAPGPARPGSDAAPLRVGFYGSIVPLQGAATLVEAAHLLRHRDDLAFDFIGAWPERGPLARLRARRGSARVRYSPILPYDELDARVRDFDIALGIFGESLKADVVIPNKVYHYAGLGLPIVTRATRGMAERFAEGVHYRGVAPEASALAAAVEELADDPPARTRLGAAAHDLVRDELTERHVARRFLEICRGVLDA